jgi:pimeloyl-ACP methyl ester carboxylesterase
MLFAVVRVVGVALLAYALLMFVAQRRLAFPGTSREVARPRTTVPAGLTQVWLGTSFGEVEAWLIRASEPRAPTLIFAHGNGELIDDWQQAMRDVAREGANVLLVEFPGYGHSAGNPTRATIRETFQQAYDWLAAEGGVDADGIIAYGRSIGGGAAADLSRDRPVRALVLQSTFSSTMRIAREMLLPGFLVRDRWDNARAVAEYQGPVLVMHGADDEVIAYAHAETVASARPGLVVTRISCGHNDCLLAWPSIVDALSSFLRAHALLAAPAAARGARTTPIPLAPPSRRS